MRWRRCALPFVSSKRRRREKIRSRLAPGATGRGAWSRNRLGRLPRRCCARTRRSGTPLDKRSGSRLRARTPGDCARDSEPGGIPASPIPCSADLVALADRTILEIQPGGLFDHFFHPERQQRKSRFGALLFKNALALVQIAHFSRWPGTRAPGMQGASV